MCLQICLLFLKLVTFFCHFSCQFLKSKCQIFDLFFMFTFYRLDVRFCGILQFLFLIGTPAVEMLHSCLKLAVEFVKICCHFLFQVFQVFDFATGNNFFFFLQRIQLTLGFFLFLHLSFKFIHNIA